MASSIHIIQRLSVVSFKPIRWRTHPDRVSKISTMSNSELSRRRLKVHISNPVEPEEAKEEVDLRESSSDGEKLEASESDSD